MPLLLDTSYRRFRLHSVSSPFTHSVDVPSPLSPYSFRLHSVSSLPYSFRLSPLPSPPLSPHSSPTVSLPPTDRAKRSSLRVCRRVGLRDVSLFTSPDLVDGRDAQRSPHVPLAPLLSLFPLAARTRLPRESSAQGNSATGAAAVTGAAEAAGVASHAHAGDAQNAPAWFGLKEEERRSMAGAAPAGLPSLRVHGRAVGGCVEHIRFLQKNSSSASPNPSCPFVGRGDGEGAAGG
ncbi:unnamed protein product, partial [Closterium sp. Naga37s-1]